MKETWVGSLGLEDPLEEEMATHSSILPGKSHGQRSLVGYSLRGRRESDATECAHTAHVINHINTQPNAHSFVCPSWISKFYTCSSFPCFFHLTVYSGAYSVAAWRVIPCSFYRCWRRQWHPTPVLLPGKSHGQGSLVDYGPKGHKDLDMTKWLHFTCLYYKL